MPLNKLLDAAMVEMGPGLTKVAVETEIKRVALKDKRDGDVKAKWHLQ